MAEVIKSVGATGRDYSTLTAFAADLNNTVYSTAGSTAVAECYSDTTISEAALVNIGLLSSNIVGLTIRAASGEEHDGTPGTGVTVNGAMKFVLGDPLIIHDMEFTKTVAGTPSAATWFEVLDTGTEFDIYRNLFHEYLNFDAPVIGFKMYAHTNENNYFHNNQVFDMGATYTGAAEMNMFLRNNEAIKLYNNTFCGAYQSTTTNPSPLGIGFADSVDVTLTNNIVVDMTNSGTGTGQCYEQASPSNATIDYCIASDTSASGTNSHDSESSSSLFVSNTRGGEDLSLVVGATNAIGGANDLGATTPSEIEFDIKGYDRDTAAVTWDIGSHQYIAVGGGLGIPIAYHHYHRNLRAAS